MALPGEPVEPIHSVHLLRRVDDRLIELLSSLTPSEWDLPTIAGSWQVRDVAAHLLDTSLRKLSLARDRWFAEKVNIRTPEDFVRFVNRLNAEGTTVYRRLSPAVLIQLMRVACDQSARFHESLDPFAPAMFPVSWAGNTTSPNWFDTARELTERWHHQQQIRLATDRPGIMVPELYHPVLDCFVRGLPHAYRSVEAEEGTSMLLEIAGDCGGKWLLVKAKSNWLLRVPSENIADSLVTIPQEIAWRVFTRGISHDDAIRQSAIEGNRDLGARVFTLTAVIA